VTKNSGIEWTDHTFNTWWGCVEDGPECDNCYARAWAKRTGHAVWGIEEPRRFFGDVHWKEPKLWNRAAFKAGATARVFCGSMCDIGERRNDAVGERMNQERAKLWELIEQTPYLTWLLLTKRPQNFPAIVPEQWMHDGFPPNVQVGTTAGNQAGWDKRVKYLLRVPARVHFVSCEPLLGPIDIRSSDPDALVRWLIAGAESGPHARVMDLNWARSLRDQCVERGTAFFFKQWNDHGEIVSLPALDGVQWAEFPEVRA